MFFERIFCDDHELWCILVDDFGICLLKKWIFQVPRATQHREYFPFTFETNAINVNRPVFAQFLGEENDIYKSLWVLYDARAQLFRNKIHFLSHSFWQESSRKMYLFWTIWNCNVFPQDFYWSRFVFKSVPKSIKYLFFLNIHPKWHQTLYTEFKGALMFIVGFRHKIYCTEND